jgi:hypothetical protein
MPSWCYNIESTKKTKENISERKKTRKELFKNLPQAQTTQSSFVVWAHVASEKLVHCGQWWLILA